MTSDRPPFMVSVEAAFTEDGVWQIEARLRFRDGVPAKVGSNVLAEGRAALVDGIACQVARGRTHGAKTIQLHLDTGDRAADIELIRSLPDPDLIH